MQNGMLGWPADEQNNAISLLTESGLYTVPMWARKIRVRLCGGGGGGGSADGENTGGDGGGSGFISQRVLNVSPGQEIEYSCGSGGDGGAGVGSVSTGNNGSNGSDTTFGKIGSETYLIARGGRSGRGADAIAGADGSGTGVGTNSGERNNTTNTSGMAGGPSPLTGVVANGSTTNAVAGSDGEYGGGGGGGKCQSASSGSAGGQGGNGWIEVEALL